MLLLNSFFQFQNSNLEKGILFFIVVFLTITLMLILSLFFIRAKRIRRIRFKNLMQAKVDHMLFQFLFTSLNYEELLRNSDFALYQKHLLFQKITVKAIISLRNNYTGEYRLKLNELYVESGLVEYSMKKLNSKKWSDNVEGIRDLSNMNVQKAYSKIEQFLNHKNNMVRTEAILGMIRLKGIGELNSIANSDIYLDDWTQSNILYILQENKIELPSDLVDLLNSKNLSVVLLVIRAIKYFNSKEHIKSLSDYADSTSDKKITTELVQTLKKLNESNNQAL